MICIATSHSSGVMFNTIFPVMGEVIQVQAMPEFVHQDCVKLIGYGGAPKHNCTLKSLGLLKMGSIATFLPTSLSTCLKWKIKKAFKEVNETVTNFSPTNVCFQMWSIKWRCKQIDKKKTFFVAEFSLWKCLCVPQGSFVLLPFYGGLLVISWF